jgi:hypothetical protein
LKASGIANVSIRARAVRIHLHPQKGHFTPM